MWRSFKVNYFVIITSGTLIGTRKCLYALLLMDIWP